MVAPWILASPFLLVGCREGPREGEAWSSFPVSAPVAEVSQLPDDVVEQPPSTILIPLHGACGPVNWTAVRRALTKVRYGHCGRGLGSATVSVAFTSEGSVDEVRVSSGVYPEPVERCLVQAFEVVRVPAFCETPPPAGWKVTL